MSSQDHAYALPSGFMLEEYQIERVLGSGGFGITYYAWDTHLDKAVAIKEYLPNEFAVRYEDTTVAPKSSSDAETYEWGLTRFLEEARILAGFDHPNINKVYRRLEAHGTAYMVLEYLPGESLSARLKRTGRLSPDEVWRLFNELLSGLSEVHRQDYVHRDIKPGNIMFREDGGAVLLDFGAARQAVGQRSKSITSILTPGYAPLEQYDQKAADVGPWSDFYALGVVAYRCVTGVGEGELLDAVARARLVSRGEREKDMRPVVELAKGQYDQRLLNAIDSCMRVDERERPQGVADLEEILADSASKKKKKPKPTPKPKPESKPRHPAIWAAVGAVVALLLGFGAWQWFSPSPPAPAPLADDPGEASAPAVVPAPPPPPRVAAEPGSLMLELSPADARVILPDIESPYRPGMALAAGSYRVVVRQAGYEEFAGTLRIEAGRRTTRTITLAEEPGSLVLELEPRDAQVMLPDIESSYRPGLALPAGEYRVVVRREGYEAFDDTLRIEAGRRTVRAITLVEAAGSLVLELSPADAQVSLPDSRLPYRPGMALPAGEYRVLVRRAGYAEFSGALRIEAGRRTTRAITLAEEPGSLVLELSPADAQVSLPDSRSPYQPGMALPAGEYRVLVRRAGYAEFSGALRIEAGRRTTRAITLAEEPGSLVLELEPADAQVSLPDIESPYRPGLTLPAGEYRVVVRREGYEAFDDTLRIESGQRTIRTITLVEELGSLMLEIEPRDARVILPDIGPRYRPGLALPAGEYRVVVRQAGYEEFEGTVRIEAGRRTTRAITLRRAVPAPVVEVFRDALKSGGKGPEMVVLPTGRFRMGDLSGDGDDDEKPVRTVTISRPIAMGKYEVHFGEYDRFAGATGRELPKDRGWGRGTRPVIFVSQEDAKAYAVWLSAQTGKRYRLPTEAEWEYAARAGTTSKYSWGNEIGSNRANCDGCGSEWGNKRTAPVGSFAANAFGLYDMHGNVREWVVDCYGDYADAPTDGSARTTGCGSTTYAVLRGGSWTESLRYVRSANRDGLRPSYRDIHLGFRLVQDLNPEAGRRTTRAITLRRTLAAAAEQGDAEAQFKLGEMYEYGRGVQQDDEAAVKWYRLAAEQGHAEAQNNLGWMYNEGRGVRQDDEEAVKWLRLAVEQGNARAQNNLGWMYGNGRGVPQDDEEAVKWYRLAAEQGNASGQNNLGWMYRNGRGVPQNNEEAVKWYRLAAEQGYVPGQINLGWMYRNGRGVPQNNEEAVKWYRLAAEQGHASGQNSLGLMYDEGRGVPQDDEEAVKWYRLAAKQGHATAQYNLGLMYHEGEGVRQDDEMAVKWYRLAAEQGHADAQRNLGWMYRNGRGVPQDDEEAVKWYRLAAEQGNASGQNSLGLMYDEGRGVPRDDEEAVKWYRLAAKQGHATAQYNLGLMYREGEGVRQDDEMAVKWFRLAAEQGHADAQRNLERLARAR